MCDIVSALTMSSYFGKGSAALTILDVVGAVGAIGSVAGSYSSSVAQKQQLSLQAQQAKNKATIRTNQAKETVAEGERTAAQQKAAGKSMQSTQLVTLAGQGGDVTSGTSVDLLAETAQLSKKEENQIKKNAKRDALAIQQDASNATADQFAAKSASAALNPLLDAGTSALKGFGQVGAQWYKRRKA